MVKRDKFFNCQNLFCKKSLESTAKVFCLTGQSSKGYSDVVGESHHGHTGLSCSCHWTAKWWAAATETIWSHKTSHITYHVQEHMWPCSLPAYSHFCPSFQRYTLAYAFITTAIIFFSVCSLIFTLFPENVFLWDIWNLLHSNMQKGILYKFSFMQLNLKKRNLLLQKSKIILQLQYNLICPREQSESSSHNYN